MNERILDLRTQAAAWVAKNHQPQDPNAYSQKEIDQRYLMYEEKFAELIVRECISTIENAENGYRDYRNQIEDAMRNHCLWLIKDKFGITE